MPMNVIDRDSLIGMVAGPLVWTAHFLVAYILVAVGCAFGFGTSGPGEWGAVRTAVIIASGIALAIIAVLILLAWRRWTQSGGSETPQNERQARHRFMAVGSLLLCFLSGVAVVYVTVPLFFLAACQ
ncbi:hypothetical protein [Rhodoligotrophos defluvii]|uniref:hypothetical protein n=1 Tax=Rhodoligotrophos defluvii TaxID=2561934 RepID=UPI0010CA1D6A|nr:hypothetical protein [Rhodoligotrophos defluvii]